MKKFWIQVVILVVVIFVALYASFNNQALDKLLGSNLLPALVTPTPLPKKTIQVGNTQIKIEVADTAKTRSQGLSGRESLGADEGILLVFQETKKTRFWMKGMKFPLDFIFIREGKVVDMLKNIPIPEANQKDQNLPVYEPVVPIDMVLEVNSGFINQYNIQVGDSIGLVE